MEKENGIASGVKSEGEICYSENLIQGLISYLALQAQWSLWML